MRYLGTLQAPALHVLWQDLAPVAQNLLRGHTLQQATYLHQVLVPAERVHTAQYANIAVLKTHFL